MRRNNYQRRNAGTEESGCGCIVWLAVLLINLVIGGWCLNFDLWALFGKHINGWFAAVIGMFLGEITITVAVICFLLHLIGVHMPMFPQAVQ